MLIREITDPRMVAVNRQLDALRKQKKQISADAARRRAIKAGQRAQHARDLAQRAQLKAQRAP